MADKPENSVTKPEDRYECLGCQLVAFFTPLAVSGYVMKNTFFNKKYIRTYITNNGMFTPSKQLVNRFTLGFIVPMMICSVFYTRLFSLPAYDKYTKGSGFKELMEGNPLELPAKFVDEVKTDGKAVKEGAVKLFSKVKAVSNEDKSFIEKYCYRKINPSQNTTSASTPSIEEKSKTTPAVSKEETH